MNKKYILAVIAVVIAGCSWDSELYQNFVDEKGDKRPVFCPKDAAKTGTELSKISMSCEKCENGVYTITREECKSKDNCGDDGFLTASQKNILASAFKYNLCPQKNEHFKVSFSCVDGACVEDIPECVCNIENAERTECVNGDENVCRVIICDVGYHMDDFKTKCIMNGNTACGSRFDSDYINCYDLEGIKEEKAFCNSDEGKCYVLECNENGYHVSSDNTKCESNTFDNCGRAGYSCFYEKGWKDTDSDSNRNDKCDKETGRCVAGEDDCFVGFHVFNGFDENENYFSCERNNLLNCGEHGVDCAVEKNNHPGWGEYTCDIESGKCVPVSCATNYHMTKNGDCALNDYNACGSEDFSCLDIPGFIESGTHCENGKCVAKKCDEGFNVNVESNLCVPQNCPNDKYYAMCNGACKTIYEDAKNCGKCGKECIPDIGTDNVKCAQGRCEFTCKHGFHLVENDDASYCEEDTDEKCGNESLNCEKLAENRPNTIGKCINGACSFQCLNEIYEPCGENACILKNSHLSHCEYSVSGSTWQQNCEEGYGDCDKNKINGCETELATYGLKYESNKCECASRYSNCGDYNDYIPLCLKLENISAEYCFDYCNYMVAHEYKKMWSMGYFSYYYKLNKCSPINVCRTKYVYSGFYSEYYEVVCE